MRRISIVLYALIATSAVAADFDPVAELAQRSKLPATEVASLLATCESTNATQMSINFCAWRDLLAAEHQLQQVVDSRSTQAPKCADMLARKLSTWKKKRDAGCEKSAKLDYEGGSMLPTAIAMCETAETQRMTKKIASRSACH
jgi:uncharacterized protein YecT (DUF1311 family)